ncbi:hypothetical protein [Aeromonas caviae]|uniref:hypothetical protein n=1 Tax=Aeromonas caviae TaxID=648 RepID=UPI0023AA62F1|nr:hypothetical protein [Aeromonas caviae]WEE21744.1 hypothetical protein PY772_22460 [Aeromonas caviae]
MDFKCDELILGKKDADSRALTRKELNEEAGEERKTLYKEAALEVIKSDYWEPSLALWGTQMIELT